MPHSNESNNKPRWQYGTPVRAITVRRTVPDAGTLCILTTDGRTDGSHKNQHALQQRDGSTYSFCLHSSTGIYLTTLYSRLRLCHLAIAYKALQNTYSSPLVYVSVVAGFFLSTFFQYVVVAATWWSTQSDSSDAAFHNTQMQHSLVQKGVSLVLHALRS